MLTPLEVRSGRDGEPFAIRTKLGWAVNGPLYPIGQKDLSFGTFVEEAAKVRLPNTSLEEAMRRFWEVDDQGDPEQRGRSVEDQRVIGLWRRTGVKIAGHHQFPIPFRNNDPSLPDNLSMALRRLAGLKARLSRNADLKECYVKEMEDLISKGYAEAVGISHITQCLTQINLTRHASSLTVLLCSRVRP